MNHKILVDKKRNTDRDRWKREIIVVEGKDAEEEWELEEYKVMFRRSFCFILLFNFMINEPSNDKIQCITMGVVAVAQITTTEAKSSKDWETRELGSEIS